VPRLVLCHRGSLDPLAYWLAYGWTEGWFFACTVTTRQEHYSRYDAVIHLVTPQRRGRCTPIGAIPQRTAVKRRRRRCIWIVSCGAAGAGADLAAGLRLKNWRLALPHHLTI